MEYEYAYEVLSSIGGVFQYPLPSTPRFTWTPCDVQSASDCDPYKIAFGTDLASYAASSGVPYTGDVWMQHNTFYDSAKQRVLLVDSNDVTNDRSQSYVITRVDAAFDEPLACE